MFRVGEPHISGSLEHPEPDTSLNFCLNFMKFERKIPENPHPIFEVEVYIQQPMSLINSGEIAQSSKPI